MKSQVFALFLIASAFSAFSQFVTLNGRQFIDENGDDFYPIASNFEVTVYRNSGTNDYFLGPHSQFFEGHEFACTDAACGELSIRGQLQEIKALGFNTIRLFGLRYGRVCSKNSLDIEVCTTEHGLVGKIAPIVKWQGTTAENLTISNSQMTTYLLQVLDIAEEEDMKVIYLAQGKFTESGGDLNTEYKDYLSDVAFAIKDHQALLAYDLFNEPLYFFNDFTDKDSGKTYDDKEDYCEIVKEWTAAIHAEEMNHLITIGLISSMEVFKFDPTLLDVDFLSLHNYHGELSRNMVWFSRFTEKPWVVGESGFSAKSVNDDPLVDDNTFLFDDGTLIEQRDDYIQTFDLCRDCMGSGYSIWLHQDVKWFSTDSSKSHINYIGMKTIKDGFKPVSVSSIAKGNTTSIKNDLSSCSYPNDNYFDLEASPAFTLSGRVVDQDGIPLAGAVVQGRNSAKPDIIWKKTFSDSDGNFIIHSDNVVDIINIGAPSGQKKWITSVTQSSLDSSPIELHQYPIWTNIDIGNETISHDFSHKAREVITYNSFTHSNGNEGVAYAGEKIVFDQGTVIDGDFTAYVIPYDNCPSFDFTSSSKVSYDNQNPSGSEGEDLENSSINGEANNVELVVFPNPVEDYFELKINVDVDFAGVLELLSLDGAVLNSWGSIRNGQPIHLDNINSGEYILKYSAKGLYGSTTLIKI